MKTNPILVYNVEVFYQDKERGITCRVAELSSSVSLVAQWELQ